MQINFTYLETLSDGDHTFIQKFISTFEETYVSLTKKMVSEFSTNDFENLGKSAHQLKPSVKMLHLSSAEDLEKIQYDPRSASMASINFIRENCEEAFSHLKIWAKEKEVS